MGAGSCLESSVGVKARGSSTLSVSAQHLCSGSSEEEHPTLNRGVEIS